MTIIEDRLALFMNGVSLKSGGHNSLDDGACLLEAVAYVAGEPWSDHPECVCPVLAAFGRAWNDGLPDDATRDRLLKPFLPRLIGTRATADVQDERAFMAADWVVRVFTPAWLPKAGLVEDAAALEALPELSTVELCKAAMPMITKARKSAAAARAAARDAAWDAARDAAWAAARDAAGAAAGDAAWAAAGDAAGDAAWAAARAAARAAAWAAAGDAAGAAAGDALADTISELQASAADLFDRMIRCGTDA